MLFECSKFITALFFSKAKKAFFLVAEGFIKNKPPHTRISPDGLLCSEASRLMLKTEYGTAPSSAEHYNDKGEYDEDEKIC